MAINAHGLGKDAEIITNEQGGRQSKTDYAFQLMPPQAMFSIAQVLHFGAQKYEPNNWKKIPLEDHLNHVIGHIYAHLAGDTQDDHLEHAGCRMMMALEKYLETKTEA